MEKCWICRQVRNPWGVLLAILAGVNMVSGVGMIDFLRCQSLEKLIVDAEFNWLCPAVWLWNDNS